MKKYLVVFHEYCDYGKLGGEDYPYLCYTDDLKDIIACFEDSLSNIALNLADDYPEAYDALVNGEGEIDPDDEGYEEVSNFINMRSNLVPTEECVENFDCDYGWFGISVQLFAKGDELVPKLLTYVENEQPEIDESLINAVKKASDNDEAIEALIDAIENGFQYG